MPAERLRGGMHARAANAPNSRLCYFHFKLSDRHTVKAKHLLPGHPATGPLIGSVGQMLWRGWRLVVGDLAYAGATISAHDILTVKRPPIEPM